MPRCLPEPPGSGANLDKCVEWAHAAGVEVTKPRRKGEIRMRYPGIPTTVTAHFAQKSKRVMTVFLRRVYELKMAERQGDEMETWPGPGRTYTDPNSGRTFYNWTQAEWEAFRANLNAYALRNRMGTPNLAAMAKVEASRFRRWLDGTERPSMKVVGNLASILGKEPRELFEKDEELIGDFEIEVPVVDGVTRKFHEHYEAERVARDKANGEGYPGAEYSESDDTGAFAGLLKDATPADDAEDPAPGPALEDHPHAQGRSFPAGNNGTGGKWHTLFLALAEKHRKLLGVDADPKEFAVLLENSLLGEGSRQFLVTGDDSDILTSILDVAQTTGLEIQKLLGMEVGDMLTGADDTVVRLKDKA